MRNSILDSRAISAISVVLLIGSVCANLGCGTTDDVAFWYHAGVLTGHRRGSQMYSAPAGAGAPAFQANGQGAPPTLPIGLVTPVVNWN